MFSPLSKVSKLSKMNFFTKDFQVLEYMSPKLRLLALIFTKKKSIPDLIRDGFNIKGLLCNN